MVNIPEQYVLRPNKCAPNSDLPILVYRDALPLPLSEAKATEFLERTGAWQKRGTFGHISWRHFHQNTHESYGIFQGESTMLLGQGHGDEEGGIEVTLYPGDVIVLPAGTAHVNKESTRDYKYIGIYPTECPKWRNDYGKEPIDLDACRKEINAVPMPRSDPVNGEEGPLPKLWGKVPA